MEESRESAGKVRLGVDCVLEGPQRCSAREGVNGVACPGG